MGAERGQKHLVALLKVLGDSKQVQFAASGLAVVDAEGPGMATKDLGVVACSTERLCHYRRGFGGSGHLFRGIDQIGDIEVFSWTSAASRRRRSSFRVPTAAGPAGLTSPEEQD